MLETRAVTPAPTNVSTQQAEILQPIFGMRRLWTFLADPHAACRAPGAAYVPDHQYSSRAGNPGRGYERDGEHSGADVRGRSDQTAGSAKRRSNSAERMPRQLPIDVVTHSAK